MKVELNEAEIESNIQGESAPMVFSEAGFAHLMSLFTNLYNNPELAVVREYFTNAVDAQVGNGSTLPVEVTAPTWDTPNYVVKDHGVGMSKDDIFNIYRKYGESTKRNTNAESGYFGLGCKSALAITSQFSLTTIKNGKKTTVLISNGSEGNMVNIVRVVDTDEPTGTTVTIPVTNTNKFIGDMQEFFKYIDPSKVTIKGSSVISVGTAFDGLQIFDAGGTTIYINPNRHYAAKTHVMMGGVPYFVSADDIESMAEYAEDADGFYSLSRHSMILAANIGDVELTPNRESLRFTDKTREWIASTLNALVKTMKVEVKEKLKNAETLEEYTDTFEEWKYILGDMDFKFKDFDFSDIKERLDTPILCRVYRSYSDTFDSNHSFNASFLSYIGTNSRQYVVISPEKENDRYPSQSIRNYLRSLNILKTNTEILWDEKKQITDKYSELGKYSTKLIFTTPTEVRDKAREYVKANPDTSKSKERSETTYLAYDVKSAKHSVITLSEIKDGAYLAQQNSFRESSTLREHVSNFYYYKPTYSTDATLYGERTANTLSKMCEKLGITSGQIVILSSLHSMERVMNKAKNTVKLAPIIDEYFLKVKKEYDDTVTANSLFVFYTNSIKQFIRHFGGAINDPVLLKAHNTIDANINFHETLDDIRSRHNIFGTTNYAVEREVSKNLLDVGLNINDYLYNNYPMVIAVFDSYSRSNVEKELVEYINWKYSTTVSKAA